MYPREELAPASIACDPLVARRPRALAVVLVLALATESGTAAADATATAGQPVDPASVPDPSVRSLFDDPGAILLAQAVNPATSSTAMGPEAAGQPADSAPTESSRRLGSWEMPAVIVEGQRLTQYREEDPIGSYGQPRWTAHRRFAGTRVYVRPEGQVDFEQWFRWKDKKNEPDELVTQSEIEFGLPHRFQLDYYLITNNVEGESTTIDNALEIRYAFADWGKLWGNPTLYVEWISTDSAPDVVETKLLFGGDVAPGWHWGANLVWEQETGGSRASTYEFTAGLSQTLIDMKFSWGLETKLEWEDESGSRGDYSNNMRLGPSFQWRPMPQMHIDFAPLFGLTSESVRSDIYLILGYEF